MRFSHAGLEGWIEGADLLGLLGRSVRVGVVGDEEVTGRGGAHGVAEESDLVIQIGERAAKEGKDSAARAQVGPGEQGILR